MLVKGAADLAAWRLRDILWSDVSLLDDYGTCKVQSMDDCDGAQIKSLVFKEDIHCPPILWNHPGSASVLLYLNSAIFQRNLAVAIFEHIENVFIYTNTIFMCFNFGVAKWCLKKLAPFKDNKMDALQGWSHKHDDVIKWNHFPRHWPFVRGIHWSPVNSPHKGPWRGALILSLICAWINGWVNNHEAGDLRRHRPSLWRHCNEIGEQCTTPNLLSGYSLV